MRTSASRAPRCAVRSTDGFRRPSGGAVASAPPRAMPSCLTPDTIKVIGPAIRTASEKERPDVMRRRTWTCCQRFDFARLLRPDVDCGSARELLIVLERPGLRTLILPLGL